MAQLLAVVNNFIAFQKLLFPDIFLQIEINKKAKKQKKNKRKTQWNYKNSWVG